MNMRSLPLLPVAVLIALVILTFWLSRFVQPINANADGKLRHDPESIIEKFVAKKMSPTGDIQYVLKADRMMHYPDDDSSKMENVLFTATEPGKPELTVRAPNGHLLEGSNEIRMEGGVVMQTQAAPHYPPMQMMTPTLHIYPKQNLARSTTGVVFTTPTLKVNAATFEFNSQSRTANLTRVKGSMSREAAFATTNNTEAKKGVQNEK